MTKKHYKVFAALISKMRKRCASGGDRREDIINEFETVCVEMFAEENSAFNITKFMEAAR